MTELSAREIRRKALGALIRKARKQASRSQTQCANLLNVSTQSIIDLESGEADISATQLETLANYFGVRINYFWNMDLPAEGEEEAEQPDIVQERMWLRQKLIGVQLRQARQKAEKTQKDCAERLNVSARNISEYEYGRRDIPLVELEALAEYLETPIETFLDYETEHEKRFPESKSMTSAESEIVAQVMSLQEIEHLTPELREFVALPVNSLYLHLAHKLSQLPANVLREIGESLLEITY